MSKYASRPAAFAATAFLMIVVLGLTVSRGFYNRVTMDISFSLLLASMAIVCLHVRPLSDSVPILLAACALIALQVVALGVALRIVPALALLGISSLLLLGFRSLWATGEQRQLPHLAFLTSMLFVLLGYSGSTLMEMTDRLHPKALDLFLYSFDASLGMQPSFATGRLLLKFRWLTPVAVLSYVALPIPLMLVYAKQLRVGRNSALPVFAAFFFSSFLGIALYNLFPACGPVYLFGGRFPLSPFSPSELHDPLIQPVLLSGARNAFPSMHMAWALLAWWYSEGLSAWTRLFLLLFLALTVLATLGLGEHYFIDLVVAFPCALLIRAACSFQVPLLHRRRSIPLLAAMFLTLGWIALLRFGLAIVWLSPLFPWILIAGTVVPCLLLEPKLRATAVQPDA